MKRVLVTGGAGFIGSHLCERLLNAGHHVICLDNFFTGSRNNIKQLIDNKNFEVIEHDIVRPIDLKADQIYNLACPASPVHYQADPIKTTEVCIYGSINMIELAKRNNARILQASTSEVYGDPEQHPQKETYQGNVNPIGPRACYDEGKRCAETLFFDYHRRDKVDIKVIRIFNTYGPKMHPQDGRVVSNFIMQALRGEDITIYGEGQQTRSFCYVDDLVTGITRMMESSGNFTGPVNLGNPHEMTMIKLADLILKLSGSRSKLVFRALPKDDPTRRQPDITMAKEKLKWEPKINVEDGIQKTIEYFRSLIEDGSAPTNK